MSIRRLIVVVIAALGLGMLVAMLGGRPRQVSIAVWMSVAAGWVSWIVVRDLLSLAPLRPERSAGLLRRRKVDDDVAKPRGLTSVEGMLASSANSPRAATIRLRPRLVALTGDLLKTRHGIIVAEQPDRAAAVFGDLAWIVDGDVAMQRSPTLSEVDKLITRALAEESSS